MGCFRAVFSVERQPNDNIKNKAASADAAFFVWSLMSTVLAWLVSLPPLFWSAIFTSFLTLGGVLLIDRGNTKRLKQQLESGAEEAKIARAATLRKEVYLKTVAELSKGMASLAKLPQADLTDSNFSDGFNNFYEIAAQFQLVGELSTSILMTKFVGELSSIHMKAIARLPAIYDEKLKSDGYDAQRIEANKKCLDILAEQKRLESAGLNTSAEFARLAVDHKFWHKNSQENFTKQTLHSDNKNSLSRAADDSLMNDLATCRNSQIDLLVKMRMELGFESDITMYRKAMEEAQNRIFKETREIISKMISENK